jgi:hypothetical protein
VTTTSSVSKSIIGALSRISTASAQATGGSSARRFSAGCASDAGAGDGAIVGRRAGAGLAVGLGRGATVARGERVGAGVAVGEARRVSVAFTAAVGFESAAVGGGAGGATVGVGRRGSGVLAPTVRDGRTASIRTLPGGGAEPK